MLKASDKIKDVAEVVSLVAAFVSATSALSIFVLNRLAVKEVTDG